MAINITAKGDPEKKLKWAFKMYDVDGNGEIDKNEMTQIITVSCVAYSDSVVAAFFPRHLTVFLVCLSQSIYDLIGLDANELVNSAGEKVKQGTSLDSVNVSLNGEVPNNPISVETPKTRTDQIFEKMDVDKNGVITESEFINGCLQDKFLYQMLTADYSDNN